MRHLLPIAATLGLALIALPVLAEQPFDAERSWQIQRIGDPTLSPDGTRIIAPVTRFDLKEDLGLTDLYIWNSDGSGERRFTTAASSEAAPAFSPDGRQVLFVAKRDSDTANQIYVMPIDGGEATRLTNIATGAQSPRWFADGKRIAFVSRVFADLTLDKQGERVKERETAKVKALVWDGASASAWDTLLDERQFHLFAVAVDGGEITPITLGTGLQLPRGGVQGTDGFFDIAPDGSEAAFVADSDPAHNVSNADVFTIRIGSKEARNLTQANSANDGQPRYSRDGKHLAFVQQRIKGFYADRGRLMLLDRASGSAREPFPEWDRSASGLIWAADSRSLFAAIDDAGTQRVYQFALNANAPRAITGESSFSGLALAKNGALVGVRQSFIEPPTLVAINPRDGSADKLSTLNDELLKDSALGTFESVTYAGANGAPIQMWVNYPPGFDRSKKYPFFMLIHGGPHNGITNGMSFRWNAQVFASWGYVTAWPNFHGSSGFGQDFTDAINPNWADLPYEDVIKAAEWFAGQPWIDASRMVAGGGSYGGYLTSVILGREHPFRALVAHAKVYNLYTQYGADFAVEKPRFGGFWEGDNRAMLEKTSPHYHAANFKTPTLVIHGQRDLRVPVNHGFELYQTLVVRGVPTRMVYFPDENHWVLKPQNSLFWYAEVKRWFDEHNAERNAED